MQEYTPGFDSQCTEVWVSFTTEVDVRLQCGLLDRFSRPEPDLHTSSPLIHLFGDGMKPCKLNALQPKEF